MNFLGIDDRLTYYNAKIQLWEYLKRRVDHAQALRNTEREAITDAESLRVYTETFRSFALEHFGGLPETDRSQPPSATVCKEIHEENLTIQNLILETRPDVRATANLYLPNKVTSRTPAILFLCGHSVNGKAAVRYQSVQRILAARGMIVLGLDPTGQGERLNYYHANSKDLFVRAATGDHEYGGFQCVLQGHNLSRYMLHDAIRALDFLVSHPLVDPARIGITGNSGGGTQTSLMMLIEPRLAAAAPGTFITSRRAIFDSGYAQDSEQIWRGFSDAGYDHVDLLAAFAPKPLCILGVEYDFFPIEGTRETVQRAKPFWKLFGQAHQLELVEDRATHGYTEVLGRAAADFFVKALGVNTKPAKENIIPLPDAELNATQSGQILGDFPESKTIFDENCEAFASAKHDTKKGLEFLKAAVFKDRQPVDLNLRITQSFPLADITADSGFWWSQERLLNSGILLRSTVSEKAQTPVTIALWEDGSRSIFAHDAWIRSEVAKGRAVLVLNVTGMGPIEPYPFHGNPDSKAYYSTFFRINDDLMTLNDSFAALRTYDVLRSLDVLEKWEGLDAKDVQFYLHGRYGIYAALASALDNRITTLQWDVPLCSYTALLTTKFYNDRDVKSLIIPGLIQFADWTDLAKV